MGVTPKALGREQKVRGSGELAEFVAWTWVGSETATRWTTQHSGDRVKGPHLHHDVPLENTMPRRKKNPWAIQDRACQPTPNRRLPFRTPGGKSGYPTWEDAQRRIDVVTAHYEANNPGESPGDLVIVDRRQLPETETKPY